MAKRKKREKPKCFCGHLARDHTLFVGGEVNKKGSRYVCTKDGCNKWDLCDLKIGKYNNNYSVRAFFSR